MDQTVSNDDTVDLHQALVDKLTQAGHIATPQVEAAFRVVRRHLFLPDVAPEKVYADEAIPTKLLENGQAISSSSQPAIMAIMLEQLALEPGLRVLEIGAGTGYNAALIAQIVGQSGQVVTLDIDDDIAARARAHLAAAGFDLVQVICGDGAQGFLAGAPYDRIILTVGAWEVLPAWQQQLKPGGRLVLPLSLNGPQKAVAFGHAGDHMSSASVVDCGFMRLRGAFAAPDTSVELGPEPGLSLTFDHARSGDPEALYSALLGPRADIATAVKATPLEVWGNLTFWLALREPDFCSLHANSIVAERDLVPLLFEFSNHGGSRMTHGLSDGSSLAMLMRLADQPPAPDEPAEPPFELYVRGFGSGAPLAQRLAEQVIAWDRAGRPATDAVRISSYPQDTPYTPSADEVVLEKRWSRLVLDWR
jgi:protein-L-isoaspartate(D-aspartate) O-methyltransferase